MAFNTTLANRIREHLSEFTELEVEEKKMFGGLTFTRSSKGETARLVK
jgi:hypothetical protein